jgi:uncharacterized membrane protein
MTRLTPLLLLLGGCPGFGSGVVEGTLDEVPANPTYVEHVGPILDANCVRCHDDPAHNGAPFSLATYEDAFAHADRIVVRAVDEETMPLGGPPLDDIAQETLALWLEQGAVEQ